MIYIMLPEEVRVCLVRQHFPDQPRSTPKIERLPEYLHGTNTNLTPSLFYQRVYARPVNVLFEPRPTYGRRAHGTALSIGVQRKLRKCRKGFGRREPIGTLRINKSFAAISNGGNLAYVESQR